MWRSDRDTGLAWGPIDGGRLFHGPSHGMYVRRFGTQAGDAVRDSLLRAKLRSRVMKSHHMPRRLLGGRLRAMDLGAISYWFGVLLLAFVLLFAGVSVRGRHAADEATSLSRRAGWLIALGGLVPITGVAWAVWRGLADVLPEALLLTAIPLSLVTPVLAPLLIVRWTRRPAPQQGCGRCGVGISGASCRWPSSSARPSRLRGRSERCALSGPGYGAGTRRRRWSG